MDINTFTAIVDLSRFNNSCLKSYYVFSVRQNEVFNIMLMPQTD